MLLPTVCQNYVKDGSTVEIGAEVGPDFSLFGVGLQTMLSVCRTVTHEDIIRTHTSGSTAEEYTIEVQVGPLRQKHVKCLVETSTFSVPYTKTIRIDDAERRIEGVWNGVFRGGMTVTVVGEERLEALMALPIREEEY